MLPGLVVENVTKTDKDIFLSRTIWDLLLEKIISSFRERFVLFCRIKPLSWINLSLLDSCWYFHYITFVTIGPVDIALSIRGRAAKFFRPGPVNTPLPNPRINHSFIGPCQTRKLATYNGHLNGQIPVLIPVKEE